ncbi:MAG TPA: hypothetical protein VFC62_04030 [Atopostipes sp.]|nr:hypothetical protein [Oscillospiraceae bacterium]HZK23254.1 hypothetical protein [Atopostipes sp.]
MGFLKKIFSKPKEKTEITGMVPTKATDMVVDYPIVPSTPGQFGWSLHMAFGTSTSANYNKAVQFAKAFPSYRETGEGRSLNHVITVDDSRESFLNFIILYDLVGNWKSTVFNINGEMVDRKTMGSIKYCYGDKCRSVKEDFCFGASMFTENPFGCHRLQISQHNNPWWNYYYRDGKGYTLNYPEMMNRIERTNDSYRYCPAFNLSYIKQVADFIPKSLNKKQYDQLMEAVRRSFMIGY